MRKYFMLEKDESKKEATLNIFGDITSSPWIKSDVSNYNLSKQLAEMKDVEKINVHISSYGGEVAEGLAIYNSLRNHKAKVTTHCDGFACSIASVIFMAGDERIMNDASLLMIHNAWTMASGNAKELRKQADDLEKITQASVEAYKAHSSLSEEEIKALMDAETWILPSKAIEYGFATQLETTANEKANQSVWLQIFEMIKAKQEAEQAEEDEEETQEEGQEAEDETADEKEPTEEPTDDPETEEETEDEDEEESEELSEEEENAVQKWSGFFNAIMK